MSCSRLQPAEYERERRGLPLVSVQHPATPRFSGHCATRFCRSACRRPGCRRLDGAATRKNRGLLRFGLNIFLARKSTGTGSTAFLMRSGLASGYIAIDDHGLVEAAKSPSSEKPAGATSPSQAECQAARTDPSAEDASGKTSPAKAAWKAPLVPTSCRVDFRNMAGPSTRSEQAHASRAAGRDHATREPPRSGASARLTASTAKTIHSNNQPWRDSRSLWSSAAQTAAYALSCCSMPPAR